MLNDKLVFTYTVAELKQDLEEYTEGLITDEEAIEFAKFLDNAEGLRQDILNHLDFFEEV